MIRYHINSHFGGTQTVEVESRSIFVPLYPNEYVAKTEVLNPPVRKFISIDRKTILENKYLPGYLKKPVIVVEYDGGRPEEHWHQVEILGPSRVVYNPENREPGDPMAHAWIETTAELKCR